LGLRRAWCQDAATDQPIDEFTLASREGPDLGIQADRGHVELLAMRSGVGQHVIIDEGI
jgi:hypothetical protein